MFAPTFFNSQHILHKILYFFCNKAFVLNKMKSVFLQHEIISKSVNFDNENHLKSVDRHAVIQ